MSIFKRKKKYDEEAEQPLKFFSEDEIEYKMHPSQRPIVVKNEKPKKTSRVVKRGKPAPTEKDKDKKEKKPIKKAAEAKDVVKKDTKPKPEAKAVAEPKKAAQEKSSRSGSFDIKKAKDGRYVFNLYSANKVLIATSQTYSSSQSAMTGIKSVMANALKAEIEDLTLKKPEPKSYPKWEIYADKAGEFRFRLNASNASCVCHSKMGYASKANCKRAIESIIRLAEDADIGKSYVGKKEGKK